MAKNIIDAGLVLTLDLDEVRKAAEAADALVAVAMTHCASLSKRWDENGRTRDLRVNYYSSIGAYCSSIETVDGLLESWPVCAFLHVEAARATYELELDHGDLRVWRVNAMRTTRRVRWAVGGPAESRSG